MTYEEFLDLQDVHAIKYYHCPYCDEVARLLVEIEDDNKLLLDELNRKQYFCLHCLEPFSVGTPIIPINA